MRKYEIWVIKDGLWPFPWMWKVTEGYSFIELGSAATKARAIRNAQTYIKRLCRAREDSSIEDTIWRKVAEQGCEKNIEN